MLTLTLSAWRMLEEWFLTLLVSCTASAVHDVSSSCPRRCQCGDSHITCVKFIPPYLPEYVKEVELVDVDGENFIKSIICRKAWSNITKISITCREACDFQMNMVDAIRCNSSNFATIIIILAVLACIKIAVTRIISIQLRENANKKQWSENVAGKSGRNSKGTSTSINRAKHNSVFVSYASKDDDVVVPYVLLPLKVCYTSNFM